MWLSIIVGFLCRNDIQLGYIEERDDLSYPSNILPVQNELCPDPVWPRLLSSSLPYRKTESIPSLSSPSSGSRYSSECSPSSSPVPSPADSVTGRSDSDTENELLKIRTNLQIRYVNPSDVPPCCAHSVNDRSPNNLVTSNVTCGPPCNSLGSDRYVCFQPSHSTSGLPSVQPAQSLITAQSVYPANPADSVQSATSILLAPHVRPLQPAQMANCLQAGQPASCLHPAQSSNSLQSAQPATCSQPVQSTSCFKPAQLAVDVQQTQPVPPAIRVKPGCQNIQLSSSTNTQTLIIPKNVQPFPYIPPHPPNIQQGPVIPETVAVSARERIVAKVDKAMKDRVVMTLAKLPDDQLSRGDKHGDT